MKTPTRKTTAEVPAASYIGLVEWIGDLLESARRASARAVNALISRKPAADEL